MIKKEWLFMQTPKEKVMEIIKCIFFLGLSFAFHCIVWEDDYVKSKFWKIYWAIMIMCFSILMITV